MFIREPENSWEVSYVISIKKPGYPQGIDSHKLLSKIGSNRSSELSEWANNYYYYSWFSDHSKKYPPIKLPPKENQ